MKEGWSDLKITDVATIIHGKNQKEVECENGQYPIYGSGGNIMGYSKEFLCEEGTIILGRKGSINNPIFINTKFWNVDTAFGIVAKNGCNKKYLYYFMKSYNWAKLNTGTTIPSLTQKVVGNVEIPVPSLPEQQRIVDFLDTEFAKIDALKANAEKNLQNAKDLFQAALKKELEPKEGWRKLSLSGIGITQTGTTPKTSDKCNYGNFIPFIKPADVNIDGLGGLKYDNEGLSEQGANIGRIFEKNSILMVCIGATIGKVGFSTRTVSSNQQINVLTPSKQYDYKFVYYVMSAIDFQIQVINEGKSAQATLPIINKSKWEKLLLSIPPTIIEQQNIVLKLDKLSANCQQLQTNYEKIIALCDDMKQALLRKAFNGEL